MTEKASEMAATLPKLQGVLKELVQVHDDSRLSQLSDQALQLLECLPSLDTTSREGRAVAMQLHTSGISLWNKTVALKSAAAITLSLNAQMRHIACNLVLLANTLGPSVSTYSKQITMAMKTGRAWLDCDNSAMAETSLAMASECWEKMRGQFPAVGKDVATLKTFFRVICFRAEAAVALGQNDSSMTFIQQAKELLHLLESETGYLAMLCYNFGLDMFQKESCEDCVSWLKESYEIGRGCPAVGAVKQARTLRLLASAYLEWDSSSYWQKALNAIGLANSEHSHPAGLLLKTNIMLQHDIHNERLKIAFEDTLRHPELTLDIALATLRLAIGNQKADLASCGLQLLARRYQSSPDLPQVHLLQLEFLLEKGRSTEAKQLVEDCIISSNTGDPLDGKSRKQFHLILWEQASRAYEGSKFAEALCWYNYSLSLFSAHDGKDNNAAKLHRNKSSCYIQLEQYDQASDSIQQACEIDDKCPQNHFLAFKIALLQQQEEKAIEHLRLVASVSEEDGEDITGLICLAAQMAFERSNRDLAVLALEKLVECSSCSIQQLFTALRCLIRLKLTFLQSDTISSKINILHSLLSYIQTAHTKLEALTSAVARENEAGWFLKIAWNLALQCEDNYHEMCQFFTACYKLSRCVPMDSNVLSRQKTCQLMAAAASVQAARNCSKLEEKISTMESVLEHVSICRALSQKLKVAGTSVPSDPTHSLLALYEFEAKLILGHQHLDAVLDKVSKLAGVEPKTFETLAALAVRASPSNHAVAVCALKLANQRYLQATEVDGERVSKSYHSLVQLVMGSESSCDTASKEQAWTVLVEVLEILDKVVFPEMEVLWFLAKAWNCGIHLYSALRYKEAERWCSIGMRFLKHLSQLKSTYEDQISSVYTEVLAKV